MSAPMNIAIYDPTKDKEEIEWATATYLQQVSSCIKSQPQTNLIGLEMLMRNVPKLSAFPAYAPSMKNTLFAFAMDLYARVQDAIASQDFNRFSNAEGIRQEIEDTLRLYGYGWQYGQSVAASRLQPKTF